MADSISIEGIGIYVKQDKNHYPKPTNKLLFNYSHRCIYASVNRVSIGSDNGLSPIRRQIIILTSAGLLLIGPSEKKPQ